MNAKNEQLPPSFYRQCAADITGALRRHVNNWRTLPPGSPERTRKRRLFTRWNTMRERCLRLAFAILLLILAASLRAADTNQVHHFTLTPATIQFDGQNIPTMFRIDTATGQTWVHSAGRWPVESKDTNGTPVTIMVRADTWYPIEEYTNACPK